MENFFEDLSIKWPKKVFWFLIGLMVTISTFYGLFTWDRERAVEFYINNTSLYVTGPLVNYAFKRGEKISEMIFTPFIEKVFESN